jgi:uncharacterized membrane protein
MNQTYILIQSVCGGGENLMESLKARTKLEKVLLILSMFGIVSMFVYAIWIWPQLPETIPSHFNLKGEPDGFGGKGSILILPFVGLGIFIWTTFLSQLPDAFNYTNKVTEEQKQQLYINWRICGSWLQTEMIIFFLYGNWKTAQVALGKANGLGVYALSILLIAIFGTIIYYAVRGKRLTR